MATIVNTGPVYHVRAPKSRNNATSSPTIHEKLDDIQGSIKAVVDNTAKMSNAVVALEKGFQAMTPHKPPSHSPTSPVGIKSLKATLFEEPLEDHHNYWQAIIVTQ